MLGMDMRLAFGEMLVVSVHCKRIVMANEATYMQRPQCREILEYICNLECAIWGRG
jgi:hypothetical protein